MTDGRKYQPAHRAHRPPLVSLQGVVPRVAAMTLSSTLGLTGVGLLAASPASADDLDARIDQAQAQVERLDARAAQRAADLDAARERATASREKVERLTERIREQHRLADTLRGQVARGVIVGETDGGGAVVPVADEPLPETSEDLLAGVAMVTEDTDGRAQRITETAAVVDTLRERRSEVREVLQERRAKAERAGARAAQAGKALAAEQGELDGLEAERAQREEEAAAAAAEAAATSAVDFAMAQVGKSYVWGASGPSAYDCSGLTMAAWATEGVSLPHNSGAQYASGTPVSESELQPGDLVFYYSPISHVGMYVGNGQVVNALNPGSGVQVSGLHDMPFSGAVRPG